MWLFLFLIQKIATWRPLSGHLNFDPVKIREAYELQKGMKLRGWKVVFFNRGPKLLPWQT